MSILGSRLSITRTRARRKQGMGLVPLPCALAMDDHGVIDRLMQNKMLPTPHQDSEGGSGAGGAAVGGWVEQVPPAPPRRSGCLDYVAAIGSDYILEEEHTKPNRIDLPQLNIAILEQKGPPITVGLFDILG